MTRPRTLAPRPKTILIVEDDAAVRVTIAGIVRLGGHEAVTADSGAKAFALLSKRLPDLILCDRLMPGMSGFELLTRIRALRPDLDAIPFVYLTALGDNRDMQAIVSLRPTAYLTKPVRARALLETIDALLGIDKRRDDVDGIEVDGPQGDADGFELVTVPADTR